VCCVGCRKSHFLALNPVTLPEELSAPISHKPDSRVTVPRSAPVVMRPAQAGKNKKKRERRRAKQGLARQEAAKAAAPKLPDAAADVSEVPALQEETP
jgi:hypothetical protein